MNPNIQAIRDQLGKPYFESEDTLLYRGDCLELMGELNSESIDLVVTSPPYNIGKEYEKPLPIDEYVDWCGNWITQLHRPVKQRGSFWLNLGYVKIEGEGKAVPLPYLLWDKSPFYLVQEVIWNYGAGVAARRSFSASETKNCSGT